jgi:hypothetical protein
VTEFREVVRPWCDLGAGTSFLRSPIEHATEGEPVEVRAAIDDGSLTVAVRDKGTWNHPNLDANQERGGTQAGPSFGRSYLGSRSSLSHAYYRADDHPPRGKTL